MIEAVNSVLSNAQYTRAVAEQQSVANSYAANPERVQQASTQAPYLSLYIKVDTNFDKAILQIRDNESGDVLRQIPTESQLEAYRRAQSSNAVRAPQVIDVPERIATEPKGESAPVHQAATFTPTAPAPAPVSEPAQTSTPVSIDTEA